MRKTLVIAAREYVAAVKSKAFVISLVLMPLMMFGGIGVQRLTAKMSDVKTRRIAVIDRSPGGKLFDTLLAAAEDRNKNKIFDKATGKQVRPMFVFEKFEPAPGEDEQAVGRQRLELSDRVRRDELFAFAEIGKDILSPKFVVTTQSVEQAKALQEQSEELSQAQKAARALDQLGENNSIRYSTNKPTAMEARSFIQESLSAEVYRRRMAEAGLPFAQVMPLLTPPAVSTFGLTKLAADGKIVDATRENEVVRFMVPLALLMLMFLIVMVGASPLTANLIEEKQLRIAEVLLGSVRPFELLMGKLIGGVGVALTLAVLYFIGVYVLARQFNVADVVSGAVIFWFIVFTIVGTLMYGAMFVAAGAAVSNIKEAQSMITPVVLLIVLPLFILESLLRDPSGPLATIGSFFPTSAPMVTVARVAIPPGVPVWQAVGSALVAIATTAVIIWAAGRIFRVGILMQGQGARVGEMMRWIWKG